MSRSGERGFTLVEVMVALTILGIAVVSLMTAASGALSTEQASTRLLEAVTLADSKLSEITALPLTELGPYLEVRSGRFPDELREYEWEATVSRSPESDRLWSAVVTVTWPKGRYGIETVFYRAGRVGVGRASR